MESVRVKPGDVLGGKYRIERVLGAGGMGVVVAAKNVDLGTRVAIKFILKDAMNDEGAVQRFLREARAAALLQSIHTARVLDTGRFKGGEHYIVMEYLEGRDLDAELRERGPMPPHVAVEYMLQASEALAEAHGMGMIHRDVKPKNLFLTKTVSGRPLVKVLDFGLAKTMTGTFHDVSLTATNAVFGSPQYMSPEQMRNAKDVDARSDIWSMGVCLYELMTGRLPFDGSGIAEICAMVLKDPPPLPSKFAPGIPPDLEATICRCLEKDPALRFQTVVELAAALEPYAAEEGSAKRILHVMEAAKKVDVPTIPVQNDAGGEAKTLSPWGSGGLKSVAESKLFWPLLAAFLVFGTIGAGLLLKLASRKATTATVAVDASDVPPAPVAPSSEPPPPTLPAVDAAAVVLPASTATTTAQPAATRSKPPEPKTTGTKSVNAGPPPVKSATKPAASAPPKPSATPARPDPGGHY